MEAIEAEGQPGKVDVVVPRALRGEGRRRVDGARDDDVGEPAVELPQLRRGRLRLQAQHEQIAHEPARVLVPVEAQHLGRRFVDGVGHPEAGHVLGGHVAGADGLLVEEAAPSVPVGAPLGLNQDDRCRL